MSEKYADIIIDISQSNVDRPFRYRIPEGLVDSVRVGSVVKVPFGQGNKVRTGYVIGLADEPNYDINKIKEIGEVSPNAVSVESKLIQLAAWMKEQYGCTMISALMTCMPVKEKVRERKVGVDIKENIPEFRPIDALEKQQQDIIDDFVADLNKQLNNQSNDHKEQLNHLEQDVILSEAKNLSASSTYLLHGVTGSGKTEVYIKMAEEVIKRGQDVIVLVPEIALTYQTVARFSSYFQDSICILNSQLSKGEKYREFMKAREGETHIMIGPRSALFAPFQNLGLIIIDEEHDTAYKSEKTPKYHAREVAIERARLEGAKVVLGTATPSIGSYYKAMQGEYKLYSLTERVKGSALPEVEIVDMREELRLGNMSIISQALYDRLREAFERKEQAMLFINRRGFRTFVSCRDCGEVLKCPNCDVSLSQHGDTRLMCHYCGFEMPFPGKCPKCNSKRIGGYGVGTETVEREINKLFPDVKTIRMDKDTTQRKGSHGAIIKKFRDGKADCLIGTQMIVKGHDFPKVTVVGNILADLSLFDTDYESSERTFDLLTQAAGRAGRDELPGNVVIQTYQTEHYAITNAAKQDYKSFYEFEMSYRKLLHFPPVYQLLGICISSEDNALVTRVSEMVAASLREYLGKNYDRKQVDCIGPAEAYIYRIKNVYRRVIYIKAEKYDILTEAVKVAEKTFDSAVITDNKKETENAAGQIRGTNSDIDIDFDFNPMHLL